MTKRSEDSWVYIVDDVIMIALAIVSIGLLVIETTTTLTVGQVQVLDFVDVCIAVIFLFEFAIKFYLAKNKHQFFKSSWWLLFASIPITSPLTQGLRALRILRLVPLLRLGRIITGTNAILDYCERFFTQTHVAYVFVIFALAVGTGATLFDYFEHAVNPAVRGFFDCFWWAMGTVTTVGYGDIYPMTTGGRITAMCLMVVGIGLTGVFTAIVASFLLKEHHRS